MGITKLTLSADEDLIREAKAFASSQHTSLSALFSRLMRAMTSRPTGSEPVGPITAKASGIISLPAGVNDRALLEDALLQKYGLKK
jgi:hypothetical protein